MTIRSFIINLLYMLKQKQKNLLLHDINNIIYLYCLKSIQLKGTIAPLEKFKLVATSVGPQTPDLYSILQEFKRRDLRDDFDVLDDRSAKILDYVIDKYYDDPNFQTYCKGDAYYEARLHITEINVDSNAALENPEMDWIRIYREAMSTDTDRPAIDYLKYNILKYQEEEQEMTREKKTFAQFSISSDDPLSLTITFDDKEQLKEFMDKIL